MVCSLRYALGGSRTRMMRIRRIYANVLLWKHKVTQINFFINICDHPPDPHQSCSIISIASLKAFLFTPNYLKFAAILLFIY